MTTVRLAFAVLFLAGPVHAADYARPLAIYGTSAGLDYLSTRHALDAGAVERNPLVRSNLAGWKAAQVGLLVGVDLALQKGGHRGKARALRITAAVVGGALAVHNWRVANAQRRVR